MALALELSGLGLEMAGLGLGLEGLALAKNSRTQAVAVDYKCSLEFGVLAERVIGAPSSCPHE